MRIAVEEIVELVARHYYITKEEITGPQKKYVFSHPRQMAMYLAREYTDASSTFIGRKMGKDHSTVLSAAKELPARAKRSDHVYKDMMYFRTLLDERKRLMGYEAAYDRAWSTWAFIHRLTPLDSVVILDGIFRSEQRPAP